MLVQAERQVHSTVQTSMLGVPRSKPRDGSDNLCGTTNPFREEYSGRSVCHDKLAHMSCPEGTGLAFVGVETLPCLLRVVALCTEPVPTLMLFRSVC